MKPKTIITLVGIVSLVVCAIFLFRSCKIGADYDLLKSQYEEAKRIAEADHELSMLQITRLNEEIGVRDEKIRLLVVENTTSVVKITELSKRLDALQGAEPSQPELEREPLVINLRLQIATLTDIVGQYKTSLAIKDQIIVQWQGKFDAQVKISEEWKKSYENEHRLRLLAEGLVTNLEGKVKIAKLKGRTATVVAVVVGGGLVYSLLKK